MKSILIIGMGLFGQHLTRELAEHGNQVMIVDCEEDKLESVLQYALSAKIGDCTNETVLKSLGIKNFDIVFVCIGTNFQSSLETTNLVKEMGAKYVVSKTNRDIHAKFLLKNGADEVIYPDRDIAEKVAARFSANNVFDYIELTEEYSIYEIPPLKKWVGKTLSQLNLRNDYYILILGTKMDDDLRLMPLGSHLIISEEHLMIIGKKKDIDDILKKMPEDKIALL